MATPEEIKEAGQAAEEIREKIQDDKESLVPGFDKPKLPMVDQPGPDAGIPGPVAE